MKKFVAEESFWNLFPKAALGVVIVSGIQNTEEDCSDRGEIIRLLAEAKQKKKKYIDREPLV